MRHLSLCLMLMSMGCASIVGTTNHPVPFAGMQTEAFAVCMAPWLTPIAALDFGPSLALDLALLPGTLVYWRETGHWCCYYDSLP